MVDVGGVLYADLADRGEGAGEVVGEPAGAAMQREAAAASGRGVGVDVVVARADFDEGRVLGESCGRGDAGESESQQKAAAVT